MYGESNMEIYNTMCIVTEQGKLEQGIETGALRQSRRPEWGKRWNRGLGRRGHGCTYD